MNEFVKRVIIERTLVLLISTGLFVVVMEWAKWEYSAIAFVIGAGFYHAIFGYIEWSKMRQVHRSDSIADQLKERL